MRYVWDAKKNRSNIARHGIAFADAVRIFDGPTVEKVDDRFAMAKFEFMPSVS